MILLRFLTEGQQYHLQVSCFMQNNLSGFRLLKPSEAVHRTFQRCREARPSCTNSSIIRRRLSPWRSTQTCLECPFQTEKSLTLQGIWVSIPVIDICSTLFIKNKGRAARVAQRFSAAFSPGCDPGVLRSSPTGGSLHGACLSLCLHLSLPLSVSHMDK